MSYNTSDAITLHSYILKDTKKIIKTFSKEEGILSFVTKNISSKTSSLLSLSSPFTLSELTYQKKKMHLHTLSDFYIKNLHLPIRQSLELIECGTMIIQSILSTQPIEKPNRIIFSLLESYINKLSTSKNPYALSLSFRLKILSLEGMLYLQNTCPKCLQASQAVNMGESSCIDHALEHAQIFSPDEYCILQYLTYGKKFSMIEQLTINIELRKKIEILWKDLIG